MHVKVSHLPGPALSESSHQLVQELPLLLGGNLVTAATHVQRVFPEGLVTGTQIESQRQGCLRTNTRTGSVQSKLANGDTHAVDTQITQSENTGAIGDTCDLNIGLGPIGNDGSEIPAILPA